MPVVIRLFLSNVCVLLLKKDIGCYMVDLNPKSGRVRTQDGVLSRAKLTSLHGILHPRYYIAYVILNNHFL